MHYLGWLFFFLTSQIFCFHTGHMVSTEEKKEGIFSEGASCVSLETQDCKRSFHVKSAFHILLKPQPVNEIFAKSLVSLTNLFTLMKPARYRTRPYQAVHSGWRKAYSSGSWRMNCRSLFEGFIFFSCSETLIQSQGMGSSSEPKMSWSNGEKNRKDKWTGLIQLFYMCIAAIIKWLCEGWSYVVKWREFTILQKPKSILEWVVPLGSGK